MKFEPMLAATMTELSQLDFPYLASPKLDGIRCVIKEGVAYSRNLKPIRNQFIATSLSTSALDGLDGELIVGDPTGPGVFNRTQSWVMRAEGVPKFKFYVFDDFSVHGHDFNYRLGHAEDRVSDIHDNRIAFVQHELLHSSAGLAAYERAVLDKGYEGVMLRAPSGRYKFGRATERENTLWKVKRFTDGEAEVLSVEEGQTNTNAPVKDELGRTKRSTHKENMVASKTVGTLIGRDLKTQKPIRISPGRMTGPEREKYLREPWLIVGQIVNYKSFEYGAKDEDRFRTFQSIRDPATMSPLDAVPAKVAV